MPFLSGLRLERAQASAQYRQGQFHNTSNAKVGTGGLSLPMLGEFFFGGQARLPKGVLPVHDPREAWGRPISSSGLRITWLGHSTLLIESDGVRILTDPVFGDRASPFSFAGPLRFHPTPLALEQIGPLDAVLLSHDHYDHFCRESIGRLAERDVPIITSLGVGIRLERCGVPASRIIELDWWEEYTLPKADLTFIATPAQHFSGRGLGDRNRTLWSSWVIATPKRRLFFSGDTGYTDEFVGIRERFGPFDVVMLEIGAFHPAWGTIHLGPANALRAFEALGGGSLLPIHWGTFDLGLHPWEEPAETLFSLAEKEETRILTPLLGQPFEPSHMEKPIPWWRDVGAKK